MASNYNDILVKPVNSNVDVRKHSNDFQMTSQYSESQNLSNLLLPNTQSGNANPLLGYQNNSFGGLYSSPSLNGPLVGYENNLQWLSDNRLQSQHNQLPSNYIPDKNINTTLPPTTSHSCCVNRFGMLDSLGVGSPLSSDQSKTACDVQSFQNKPSLSMSVIDPIQSWLNLQIPAQISSSQQYCKYGERSIPQNYNIPVSLPSQISLPAIDQSDNKQNDVCVQNQENCFENINPLNSKNIVNDMSNIVTSKFSDKHNSFEIGNKLICHNNNSVLTKQPNSSYQTNISTKEWKTSFQTMQNYISSPNLFNTSNDPQDSYLFTQYGMPTAKLPVYYSPTDSFTSFVNKNNYNGQDKTTAHFNENSVPINAFIEQNHTKHLYTSQGHTNSTTSHKQVTKQHIKAADKLQQKSTNAPHTSLNILDGSAYNNSFSDCCQINKAQAVAPVNRLEHRPIDFRHIDSKEESKISNGTQTTSIKLDKSNNQSAKKGFRISEAESSESDESNIIVEESDDIGELESEISIEEIKKSCKSIEKNVTEVLLRCLVCNVATSPQIPTNQFIHLNDSFPLTTSYQTPICKKLEQIIPTNLQNYLKIHNSFMCRRCLNLIETVEVLEVKLKTTKQIISDNFSKTVQQFIPECQELLHGKAEVNAQVDNLFCNDNQPENPLEESSKITESLAEAEDSSIQVRTHSRGEPIQECESEEEEEVNFKCSYCGKVLFTQKSFNFHLQQHTKEFTYYCEQCGKGFPVKSNLERHLNWHNGEVKDITILCELCGETFPSKNIFKSHCIKNHSEKFSFECKICGKGFSRKISLEIHSHKHTGARPFICEYCGHTFTTESNLKNHIKVCTKDLPFKCNQCPKSFVLETQLLNHSAQHNSASKFACSVCNKGFSKPSNLSYHMLSHSEKKSFKCVKCEKAFKTVWSLNYHAKAVHGEEKLFTCSVCGRHFGKEVALRDHMNSHTNEAPYSCAQCDKRFTHQTTFITHLRTHTGRVKTKTCPKCGKVIKTRMSVHMRTHNGDKPYQCSLCPLAFSVNTTLKRHMLAKHGKT